MSNTHIVQLAARERDINARGHGSDTYAMIGLPGSGKLEWADQIVGAEIVSDDYPRTRGIRASERRGKQVVRVALPVGSVIVYVEKRTDGTTQRSAVLLTDDPNLDTNSSGYVRGSRLPGAGQVTLRKTQAGWVTVVDGIEYA